MSAEDTIGNGLLSQIIKTPLVQTSWSKGRSVSILGSKHNRGIKKTIAGSIVGYVFLLLLFLIGSLVFAEESAVGSPSPAMVPALLDTGHLLAAVALALLTALFGFVLAEWNKANARVGIADALTSDILSIGRVFAAGDIIGDFSRLGLRACPRSFRGIS